MLEWLAGWLWPCFFSAWLAAWPLPLSLAASGPVSQLGWLAVALPLSLVGCLALLLSLAACASFHCGASGPQSLPSSPPGYTCRLVPNIHEFNREGGVVRTQYIQKIEKGIKLYH